jgi:hypothetical protein
VRIVEFGMNEVAQLGGDTETTSFPTGIAFIRCLARETGGSVI